MSFGGFFNRLPIALSCYSRLLHGEAVYPVSLPDCFFVSYVSFVGSFLCLLRFSLWFFLFDFFFSPPFACCGGGGVLVLFVASFVLFESFLCFLRP